MCNVKKVLTAIVITVVMCFGAIAAVVSNDAHASSYDHTVVVSGFSKHIGDAGYCTNGEDMCNTSLYRKWNEQNYGIGYEYANFGLHVYKNSYHEISVAAAYDLKYQIQDLGNYDVVAGVRLGVVTGYDLYNWAVTPFVHPHITLWSDNLGIELGLLPSRTSALTLTFKARF